MINIGKTEKGKDIELNLEKLIATRLLIQANSGGGKSYLIRRLLEKSHGQVQQIVIDLEGEFSTLREKYDYLLVGPDGEIPANIKTAEILAKKLLELNVSTIIDLSELKHHERIIFVKRFLDSLINAPKKLWHPCLVIVDEAHQFCPQQSKSESASSVIDLCTRGRKRGFAAILATQRISKLHKDAAAECNNKLVGRTGQDIDRKRAADDLGFISKEQEISLRNLEAGEFYAFGPAISKEIISVKIGSVITSHPEAGKGNIIKSAPTPENIKKVLKDVIDLPKEVEEELKSKQDYITKIRKLENEIRISKRTKVNIVDTKELASARQLIESHRRMIAQLENKLTILEKAYETKCQEVNGQKENLKHGDSIIKSVYPTIQKLIQVERNIAEYYKKPPLKLERIKIQTKPIQLERKKEVINIPEAKTPIPEINWPEEEKPLSKCAKMVYGFLLATPEREFTRTQLGLITGYSYKSGGFQSAIAALNTKEFILKREDKISLNSDNINNEIDPGEEYSLELIKKKLGKCAGEILDVLLENPSEGYGREELAMATQTQYSYTSGGFQSAVAKLNTLNLIKKTNETIKLNPEVLEL